MIKQVIYNISLDEQIYFDFIKLYQEYFSSFFKNESLSILTSQENKIIIPYKVLGIGGKNVGIGLSIDPNDSSSISNIYNSINKRYNFVVSKRKSICKRLENEGFLSKAPFDVIRKDCEEESSLYSEEWELFNAINYLSSFVKES